MDERRRWRGVLAGLLVLLLLGLMFVTARPRASLTPVERGVRDALAPVQAVVSSVASRLRGASARVQSWLELEQENRRLRRELAAVQAQNQLLMEAWRENRFLREALQLLEDEGRRLVPARVIARPLTNWWSHVTINRGERDGVRPRLPVLTQAGAVGQVLATTERTAEVLLLVDPKSAVGGVVHRTSDPVVVEGAPDREGMLRLRALVAGADLREGDVVVTSGLSRIFPPGVRIGTVTEVLPSVPGKAAEAWVQPAVDFARLEVVAVQVEGPGDGAALEKGASGDGEVRQ